MKQIKGKIPLTFDIETTGLSAIDNEFYLAKIFTGEKIATINDLKGFVSFTEGFNWERYMLITYNGENYRGGFDIPFLRTKMINKGIGWHLSNYWHLDLFPLVRKYFNTSINETEIDSVGKLYKGDLVNICKANGLEYQSSKQDTYDMLIEIDKEKGIDWLEYKKENTNEYNDMQSVYQYFFDRDKKETYVDGADMPELIKQGKYDEVAEHCERDVKRLYKLYELLIDYVSDEYINRELHRL